MPRRTPAQIEAEKKLAEAAAQTKSIPPVVSGEPPVPPVEPVVTDAEPPIEKEAPTPAEGEEQTAAGEEQNNGTQASEIVEETPEKEFSAEEISDEKGIDPDDEKSAVSEFFSNDDDDELIVKSNFEKRSIKVLQATGDPFTGSYANLHFGPDGVTEISLADFSTLEKLKQQFPTVDISEA